MELKIKDKLSGLGHSTGLRFGAAAKPAEKILYHSTSRVATRDRAVLPK